MFYDEVNLTTFYFIVTWAGYTNPKHDCPLKQQKVKNTA